MVNLGDLVHRGNRPQETLEMVQSLSRKYPLGSMLGNHDHASLNRLLVNGSDPTRTCRHEQRWGSPLLSLIKSLPLEWSDSGMLFVHGGPFDLGDQMLRLNGWQRISYTRRFFYRV